MNTTRPDSVDTLLSAIGQVMSHDGQPVTDMIGSLLIAILQAAPVEQT